MRCVIPGSHVKLFGKAVQCLSKIGSELYLEGGEEALALRTVNSSRSAFACVTFHKSFFIDYEQRRDDGGHANTAAAGGGVGNGGNRGNDGGGAGGDYDDDEDQDVKCKVGAKSCLSVFRSLATLEKTVDRCSIDLDVLAAKLVFVLHCKHGITKTYNLGFQECESLQAVFSKNLSVNVITAQSKLLQEVVSNFHMSQEEVTMRALASRLAFKNYIDDAPDPKKALLTETHLDPEEFDHYCIGVESSLTFCLKELRAILGFLDAAQQDVTMHFESGGKPLVLCIDGDVSWTADFVMATLMESLVNPDAAAANDDTSVSNAAGALPPGESPTSRVDTQLPASLASQATSTQDMPTTLQRGNNVPSVPDRLTSVRAQKRRAAAVEDSSASATPGTSSRTRRSTVGDSPEVEWPDSGFPKRVHRRPYDDSQSSALGTSSAIPSSTIAPRTPQTLGGNSSSSSNRPRRTTAPSLGTVTPSARSGSHRYGGGGGGGTGTLETIDDDDDYNPFTVPLSDDLSMPPHENPAQESQYGGGDGDASMSDDKSYANPGAHHRLYAVASQASFAPGETLVDETPPSTTTSRNRPPSSWLRSQERNNFNPMDTPVSGLSQFPVHDSSEFGSSADQECSEFDMSIVENSPLCAARAGNLPTATSRSSHMPGLGTRSTRMTVPASPSLASISMISATPASRRGNPAQASEADLSMAVVDDDEDDAADVTMEMSEDAVVDRTEFESLAVAMASPGAAAENANAMQPAASPNSRQFCALFFGGAIPENFSTGPATTVSEEVLAEDSDDD